MTSRLLTPHIGTFAKLALLAATCGALILGMMGPATATAGATDAGATWTFAPAEAPPPPSGQAPASFPVPLGKVGDIEFWAPNRGLLITQGAGGEHGGTSCAENSATAPVPCGLYAYNGVRWHLLSTECGGSNGRIAWAGPDEFWTISDQRTGQSGTGLNFEDVSLCHFLDGRVVGSYAEPLNQPESYRPMNAAACLTPDDCWFGGARGLAPNHGAFHLHWDGENMSVVYGPANHEVTSMALANQSTLLESVLVESTEAPENEAHPFLLHQIEAPGSSNVFENLTITSAGCQPGEECTLPYYGSEQPKTAGGKPVPVDPFTLAGLSLSSTYTPSGSNPEPPQLWAVAGQAKRSKAHNGKAPAHPIALRYSEGQWKQVAGGKNPGEDEPFESGEVPTHVAAEPGAAAAWVSVESEDGQAHVDRLTAEGTISEKDTLGEAQGVGKRGNSGPIACPAAHECWMATSEGWLFHLTDGSALPEDTDPNFAGIITYRPPDPGVPQLPPAEPPVENSLAGQEAAPPPPATVQQPVTLTSKALVSNVHSHVVDRYTLELSFDLTVKARVQLLASRKHKRVAQTKVEVLKAGKHTLKLRLNPHKWPNNLALNAIPLERLPTVESGGGSGGSTVAPPVKEEVVST